MKFNLFGFVTGVMPFFCLNVGTEVSRKIECTWSCREKVTGVARVALLLMNGGSKRPEPEQTSLLNPHFVSTRKVRLCFTETKLRRYK